MTRIEFEQVLDKCCEKMTTEARTTGFKSSEQFDVGLKKLMSTRKTGNPQPVCFSGKYPKTAKC